MENLTTATGKVFECDLLVISNARGWAFIRVFSDIRRIIEVFYDKHETEKLIYGDICLENFTKFVSVVNEDGAFKVCLEKE